MPDPDVVDGAILSNAADHLHAVSRAPGRPANTNPATTLSNADPAGDLSGDGRTSGALLHGDCLDVMARLLRPDGAIFYNHKWRVQKRLLQDRQDIVAGFPVR